jgi:sterol carrier protein 2
VFWLVAVCCWSPGIDDRSREETRGKHDTPRNAQFFANAGREYMEK